jgi:hypothetical protein
MRSIGCTAPHVDAGWREELGQLSAKSRSGGWPSGCAGACGLAATLRDNRLEVVNASWLTQANAAAVDPGLTRKRRA